MPRKSDKPKRNPFEPEARPYGVNKGEYGSPAQWKAAYEERMSAGQAQEVLDEAQVPSGGEWAVLGVPNDSAWEVVKRAYRKLVLEKCAAALGLNPDPKAESLFKKFRAAYSIIANRLGIKA